MWLEGSISQLMQHLKTSHALSSSGWLPWTIMAFKMVAYLRSCSLWEPCSHSISSLMALPGMEAPSIIARELSPLALDASGEDGCAQAVHAQTQAILMDRHDYLMRRRKNFAPLETSNSYKRLQAIAS